MYAIIAITVKFVYEMENPGVEVFMKKKTAIIIGTAAAAAVLAGGLLWYFLARGTKSDSDNIVYVTPVEKLMEQSGNMGVLNRFAGVVESQETWNIPQNQEKTVKEILVETGQEVTVGQPLFTYDTEQAQQDLKQAELELERMDNDIANKKTQLQELEKEKKQAGKDAQLSYTIEIQTMQTEIKQSEYQKKSKETDIAKLKSDIENATVTSEIAGIVKKISTGTDEGMYSYDQEEAQAFMTILATGDYRIKGKINEQNRDSIMQGQRVIVYSRVNADQTWSGTVGQIELDSPETNQNNMSYGSDSSMQSSSYPFYVELDDADGLMLGQHVYMELDNGQTEEKEGIWLPEFYLNDLDSKPYVWADNGKGKLEKRQVVLGEMDENTMEYQITEGLKADDAVTFPEYGLEEGMETEVSKERTGQSNPPDEGGMDEMPLDGDMPMDGTDDNMPIDDGGDFVIPEKEGAVDPDSQETGDVQ